MPINRSTPSTGTRRARRSPEPALSCPDCGHELVLAEADRYEGLEVDCTHCGTELILGRESDEDGYEYHWTLELADDVFGEDRDHE